MSWFLLLNVLPDSFVEEPRPTVVGTGRFADLRGSFGAGRRADLGSATAAPFWRWAEPPRVVSDGRATARRARDTRGEPAPVRLRVPRTVLDAVAEAAEACGRNADDVWVEAAREWLGQHRQDRGPQPPPPAPAMTSAPRPHRSWAAVDALLADLRGASRSSSDERHEGHGQRKTGVVLPGKPAA